MISAIAAAVGLGAIVAANAASPIPFERASTTSANGQSDKGGFFSLDDTAKHPISWDGQQVVFESDATNLVSGDTNALNDVFVKNYNTSANAGTGATVRVSVADNEVQANAVSMHGAINAHSDLDDARFVVFSSSATNLTDDNGDTVFSDDTNGVMDIFLRDRDADEDGIYDEAGAASTTRRVSIVNGGGLANGFSAHACVSADGRFVAFESDATNLVAGDTNAATDIFVRDMDSNSVVRVSVAAANTQAGALSFNPSISGDGRFVTYESNAANLVSADTNAATDVFVRDRDLDMDEVYDETGAGEFVTRRLSVSTAGAQALGAGGANGAASRNNFMPGSNGSGRFVVFASQAANLASGDTNGKWDIFLRDRDTDNDFVYDEAGAVSTERVSITDDGFEGNNDSYYGAVTADGSAVTFTSAASNLVAADVAAKIDCFLRDRAGLRTFRISASKTWTESNGHSYHATPSPNGRNVGFFSEATNLVASDTNARYDVFVRDLEAGMVPAPPTGLTVTRNPASDPQHKLTLVWTDNAANETGYEVWRNDFDETGYHLLPSSTGGYPTVGASIKTFADTGLTEGRYYQYLVRAVNGCGASVPSEAVTEATWPSLPAAPTGLALTVDSASQISLVWVDNATNEAGFELYRKLRSVTTWPTVPQAVLPPNTQGFSDEDLAQATLYDYRLRSFNDAGASAFTSVVSGTTTLPAPTNLKAVAESSAVAKLTWTDNSAVEAGFKIEKSTDGGSFSEIGNVAANIVTFSASGLSGGTTVKFRVRAFTGTNATPVALSAYSNEATLAVLAAPSSLTATAVSKSQINLAWVNNATGAASIKVERKVGAGGVWGVLATLAPTATSHSHTGLSPSTTVFYRVRALSGGGYSSYSNEASATSYPNAPTVPTGLAVTGTSSTIAVVTWADNANESGYKLERIVSGGTWTVIATLAANTVSFTDTGRIPDRTYSYRLRAFNVSGSSSNSAAQIVDMLKKPTNLALVTNTATSVKISWANNSTLETGYKVYRKTGAGAYTLLATVGSATATSYTDATVATGTTYTYKVHAYDPNSSSDFSNELTVITP